MRDEISVAVTQEIKMAELVTQGVITVGDLKEFLNTYEIPDDTTLFNIEFLVKGDSPVDKIYYDATFRSLTFEG